MSVYKAQLHDIVKREVNKSKKMFINFIPMFNVKGLQYSVKT